MQTIKTWVKIIQIDQVKRAFQFYDKIQLLNLNRKPVKVSEGGSDVIEWFEVQCDLRSSALYSLQRSDRRELLYRDELPSCDSANTALGEQSCEV